MKFMSLFFSLLIISCARKDKEEKAHELTPVTPENSIMNIQKNNAIASTFEETQDSLRTLILESKSNKILKSSLLQELYIRGLVNQIDDKIKFHLPFNLHGFDCGAPDCYSTDISFEFIAKDPVEFPELINFKLLEHGCGVQNETSEKGVFELVEQSSSYVNYYSKTHQSNLVILGDKRQLYYFPNMEPKVIKVDVIDKIIADYNDEDDNGIVPYQSTIMWTNDYELFLPNN